jgi:hypothetical protein
MPYLISQIPSFLIESPAASGICASFVMFFSSYFQEFQCTPYRPFQWKGDGLSINREILGLYAGNCEAYSSTLKMEAESPSETSVKI